MFQKSIQHLLFWSLALTNTIQASQHFVKKAPTKNTRATNIYTLDKLTNIKNSKQVHPIKSYHVSCKSDRPQEFYGEDNLGGVVLYLYDGQDDWRLNGIHCKIGYIILKKIENVENENSEYGQIHGNVYKSLFKEELDKTKIVGSGFAYRNLPKENKREWKFNSLIFNAVSDEYHTPQKSMNPLEQKWILQTIENWIEKRQQNTLVTDDIALTTKANLS